jgi:hypothetical protein
MDGCELLFGGVDYLTVTAKQNAPELEFLVPWFEREISRAAEREGDVRELAPQGYQGHMTEHLFAGLGKQGYMFRASSDIADELAQSVIDAAVPVHTTRVDLCVDSKGTEEEASFAARSRFFIRAQEADRAAKKCVRLDMVEGATGGDSITVGSRKARRYFRIYNKHLQSKRVYPKGTLRWELECKREFARAMWDRCVEDRNLEKVAIDSVTAHAVKQGLQPSFRHGAEMRRLPVSHRAAKDDAKYRWYLESVAVWIAAIDDDAFKKKFLNACGYHAVEQNSARKRALELPHDPNKRGISRERLDELIAHENEVSAQIFGPDWEKDRPAPQRKK